jgi:hypothetical protein
LNEDIRCTNGGIDTEHRVHFNKENELGGGDAWSFELFPFAATRAMKVPFNK